jgi:hypothetical protein
LLKGAKQDGLTPGPLTTSGPAAKACEIVPAANRAARLMPKIDFVSIPFPPKCRGLAVKDRPLAAFS